MIVHAEWYKAMIVKHNPILCWCNPSFSIQSCRSRQAQPHLCQCLKNSPKITWPSLTFFNHMIKTLSYLLKACFTLSSILSIMWSCLIFPPQNSSPRSVGGESFIRENWFKMSDLFSSLLIFTIIKTILSTFF